MAGSISLGAGGTTGGGGPPGPSSGIDGMKSPRSRMVRIASPISGSDRPSSPMKFARPAGEASIRVTSTNSLPPASDIGARVVICQKESPSGFIGSVIIC